LGISTVAALENKHVVVANRIHFAVMKKYMSVNTTTIHDFNWKTAVIDLSSNFSANLHMCIEGVGNTSTGWVNPETQK
jgi:hypothetical protein